MNPYDHKTIEKKWQEKWEQDGIYKTAEHSEKPKQFVLDMFPYPSGEGLHVGHPRGYMATDVYSRMKRMQGFNVLHPMGWDAFGLPAENYAIKHKIHPRKAVEENIARFKKQLGLMGVDYDWSREINTTDPAFYKWTQWIFLQMYHKGLAYESWEPINWCPECQTGLANEDVESDGTCERCGSKVEKKPMRQWVLKITDYADRMLADLDKLPKWPDGVKEAQRNWIGKSEGAEIDFKIISKKQKYLIFDFDGVLGDTLQESIQAAITMGPEKTREDSYDRIFKYLNNKPNHHRGAEQHHIDSNNDWTFTFGKILAELQPKIFGEFVQEVAKISDAKIAIVSSGSNDYVLPMVEEIKKLGVHPTHVLTLQDHHSKEEKIETVCKDWGVTEKDIYYFTDSKADIYELETICDKSKLIGCAWGHIGDKPLLELIPEKQLLRNWNDIHKIFDDTIKVFTTRADTLFGVTYVVLAPEHPLIQTLDTQIENYQEVVDYISSVKEKSDIDRTNAKKEKTGVALEGVFVTNSANNEQVPVWVADYVLANHGTGAVMAVPQHDERDNEFAQKYNLPIIDRALVDVQEIVKQVGGNMVSKYKLKDWVFSRQRYWGEPIPIIHCEKCGVVPVPEKDLPVTLPDVESYAPTGTGESPLANIESWVHVACPKCNEMAKRETNTMPQWAGSSWYYLRYIDPNNNEVLVDKDKEKNWMDAAGSERSRGVDVYVGGDHATRHLIYARFWHKFLYDNGIVSTEEPFPRLEFLGFILSHDGSKMSKSKGNIISPDEVIAQFGADAFRLYEMFIGPFEQTAMWNANGMVGTLRFVEKVWRIASKVSDTTSDLEVQKILNKTIKQVSEQVESFKFNTAVSAFMILANAMESATSVSKEDFKKFLQILAPFAPHVSEELWNELGGEGSIHLSSWPSVDDQLITDETVTIGIQVNGKVRAEIEIAHDAIEAEVQEKVLGIPEIIKWVEGKEIKKFIYIPKKIISIVV